MIDDMRCELRDEDVAPQRSAEILQRLTALMGNVLTEIREAEAIYNGVLLRFLESEEKANRATVKAEATEEYMRKREARDTQTVLVELIRSLRQILRSQAEEMRLSR